MNGKKKKKQLKKKKEKSQHKSATYFLYPVRVALHFSHQKNAMYTKYKQPHEFAQWEIDERTTFHFQKTQMFTRQNTKIFCLKRHKHKSIYSENSLHTK